MPFAILLCRPHPLSDAATCCRFVQNNALESLDGLQQLPNLQTLNVSNNRLTDLKGLAACSRLVTFLAAHNDLSSVDCVGALFLCTGLSTIDLQENNIAEDQVPAGQLTSL